MMLKYRNFKVGIVGSGYWGTNILKTLEDLNIKNIHIFDINKKQLLSTKVKFPKINTVNSLEQL